MLTTDAIVEGVHFLPDDPPEAIARKALRVNLSDLAAKGATPAGFLLTLALREADEAFLAPFARALGEDAATLRLPAARRRHRVDAGAADDLGHRVRPGAAGPDGAPGRLARRATASWSSGTIGDAALGLDVLQGRLPRRCPERDQAFLIGRYRVPQPRSALAVAVRDHASAAMDVSDGLAGDLAKLCAASGVSATIDATAIPLSEPAQGGARRRGGRDRAADRGRRRLRDPLRRCRRPARRPSSRRPSRPALRWP